MCVVVTVTAMVMIMITMDIMIMTEYFIENNRRHWAGFLSQKGNDLVLPLLNVGFYPNHDVFKYQR